MAYDSAFLLDIKNHVTEKLKSLGAFIDDELPDYIMVMVANKKSKSSMAKDLQLFLGEHTKKFTEWLHQTLETLQNGNRKCSTINFDGLEVSSEKYDENDRQSKSKGSKKKSSKSHSHQSDSNHGRNKHSRSRSPLKSHKESRSNLHSREPHADQDIFSIHATEDDFTLENSEPNVQEVSSYSCVDVDIQKRRVVPTSSLQSKTVSNNRSRQNSSVSTNDSSNLQSVVEVKSKENVRAKTRLGDNQPTSLLLKRAVNEAQHDSSGRSETSQNKVAGKRKALTRPVACSDVSSSLKPDSTKFFVTLSGADSSQTQVSTSGNYDEDEPVNSKWGRYASGIESARNIKARLGARRVLPPTGQKLSAKSRLGPIVSSRTRIVNAPERVRDEVIVDTEPVYEDFDDIPQDDFIELGYDDENLIQDDLNLSSYVRSNKIRLAERLSQSVPQLVVDLNETDEDEDVSNFAQVKSVTKRQQSPEKQNATKGESDRSTIPSSLERCKYWPNCRNGSSCQYIHPSEPCTSFPRCRLGAACTFIHPTCRFGVLCTRPDCPYMHSGKRAVPVVSANPSQIVCRFQSRCTNAFCQFYHPPLPTSYSTHVPHTATRTPLTVSPIPCRYGSACANRSKCPFTHLDIPNLDKLKWVAPSKRLSTGETDDGAANNTNNESVAAATTTTVPVA